MSSSGTVTHNNKVHIGFLLCNLSRTFQKEAVVLDRKNTAQDSDQLITRA